MVGVSNGTQRQYVLVGLFLILMAVLSPALAQKRIALLIGNEAYSSEIGRLTNPHNDVALLEQALKSLEFEVAVERDASLGGLTRAVNAYARRLQAAGPGTVGFFYFPIFLGTPFFSALPHAASRTVCCRMSSFH